MEPTGATGEVASPGGGAVVSAHAEAAGWRLRTVDSIEHQLERHVHAAATTTATLTIGDLAGQVQPSQTSTLFLLDLT